MLETYCLEDKNQLLALFSKSKESGRGLWVLKDCIKKYTFSNEDGRFKMITDLAAYKQNLFFNLKRKLRDEINKSVNNNSGSSVATTSTPATSSTTNEKGIEEEKKQAPAAHHL